MADLTALPASLNAGDSYTITLALPDYPASAGWSVSWSLAGPDVAAWTSAPSGDAHVLTLPAAETAPLTAGAYQSALKALRPGVVTTISRTSVAVVADVAALAPGAAVSYWQQLKTAAESALLTLMESNAPQMSTIMGRQTMFRSPDDCLRVIAQCEARLQALQSRTFGVPIRFDVVGMR